MSTASGDPQSSVVGFFREELTADGISPPERVVNIRRLRLVATAVGPQSAKTELLPLLTEAYEKFIDEDEFLFALAEEAFKLSSFFTSQELHLVVPLLQDLSSIEETVVREKAVESLSKLIEKVPSGSRTNFIHEHIIPVFDKLAKAQWFTSRVSACNLFPVAYKYCGETQLVEMRKSFNTLCHDDTPMVRRAAAAKLKDVFALADSADTLSHFVSPPSSVFQFFWSDDTQDAVRCSALNATVAIASKLTSEENLLHTVKRITGAAQDRSWRVRLCLARQLDKLIESYANELVGQELLPSVADLLQDPEQEVRTASLVSVEKVLGLLTPDQIITHIVPVLERISLDSAQPVRAALASTVTRAAVVLGKQGTKDHLLRLIQQFMEDEYHDVRLNVVKHAGEICEILGTIAMTKPILATVKSLMSDTQWRIRLSVVNQIPQLARHFGQSQYASTLQAMFMKALTDNVYAVRECAMENAMILTETFGSDWMAEQFLPKILENGTGSVDAFVAFQSRNSADRPLLSNCNGKPVSYLSRITVLQALLHLASASVVDASRVETVILPLILDAMKDQVPNVRFAAVKAAAVLASKSQITAASIQGEVKPCLLRLLQDDDLDVRYFAARSLATIESA